MDMGGGQRVGHRAEGAKVKLWNGRSRRAVPLGNHVINCGVRGIVLETDLEHWRRARLDIETSEDKYNGLHIRLREAYFSNYVHSFKKILEGALFPDVSEKL